MEETDVKKIEVISEIANAHQGEPEHALELARKSAEAGSDAVKFQIYFADELLVRSHPRYEHFEKQSFSPEVWGRLLSEAKDLGVMVYADVFGLRALKVAAESNLDGFKVHSSDLSNTRLLCALAQQEKKVFLAVGGSTILEIKYALEHINKVGKPSEIVLLHGFQAYPTASEDTALARLGKLRELFGDRASLGYSDHLSPEDEFSVILPLMAIPYEIVYIEKHVTLDRAARGVDYYSSCEPAELQEFVKALRRAERAIGQDPLAFSDAERRYRGTVKKQWTARRDIQKGEDISDEDIVMRRTGASADAPLYENIVGKRLTEPIKQDAWISKYHLPHKVLAIVVARFDSSRLPGKAGLDINGRPAIAHLFERLRLAKERGYVDTIAFCTSTQPSDDKLVDIAKAFPLKLYRGPVEDVLARMMLAIDDNQDHDIVLRITGDDLLIDPAYIRQTVEHHLKNNAHYTDAKDLPGGTEVEVFDASVLKFICELSKDSSGTEYLTNYIRNNADQFHTASLPVPERHRRKYRLTLDTRADYEVIRRLLEHLASKGKPIDYTLDDICDFFENHPEVRKINDVATAKTTAPAVNTEIDWSHYTRTPLVTVYITNHNYEKYIRQAIDSVLAQKFRRFEVIIIDDGSTDNSKTIIETYRNDPKVTIVYQQNKGLNVTCNIALKLSRGKYIMRLDADDYLDENALLVMAEMLEREDELQMVFPDYYLIDESGEIMSQQRRHDFREVKLLDQPAHGACTMIRKKTLIDVGGYGEEYGCQDGYELWLKFTKTHKVSNVGLPLFYYRQHDKNLTRNKHAILNTRHDIIRRHVQEYDVASRSHLCVVPIRSSRDASPLAVRPFAGTTLLDLTLRQIQQTENIRRTVVTSSDAMVLECAKKYESSSVMIDKRPEALCALNTRIEDTIDYLLDTYRDLSESETITIVNYEYPLRKPFYIDKIINVLYLFEADAAVAVEQKDANFYFHRGVGLVPFDTNRKLRLERDFVYEETGGLHSIKCEAFKKHHDMLAGVVSHIVLDELSTQRVGSDLDFDVLEYIYKKSVS